MSDDTFLPLQARVLGSLNLSVCNGCDQCGLRCTAGVQMTRDEFEQIQRARHNPARALSISTAEEQNKQLKLQEGVTVQICRFRNRETGRCTVYPERPLICRLMGHTPWMPCPVEAVPNYADMQDSIALMQAYARHPRRTYEEWAESLSTGAQE